MKVNNTADLLQSSSVIGSALQVLEKVSPESLVGKIRPIVYHKNDTHVEGYKIATIDIKIIDCFFHELEFYSAVGCLDLVLSCTG